jgi:hypothetical protein
MPVVWSGVLVLAGRIGLLSVDFLLASVVEAVDREGMRRAISVNKSVVMLKPQTERGSCLGGVLPCR